MPGRTGQQRDFRCRKINPAPFFEKPSDHAPVLAFFREEFTTT
jgi:hypothetical protein